MLPSNKRSIHRVFKAAVYSEKKLVFLVVAAPRMGCIWVGVFSVAALLTLSFLKHSGLLSVPQRWHLRRMVFPVRSLACPVISCHHLGGRLKPRRTVCVVGVELPLGWWWMQREAGEHRPASSARL